MKPNEPLNLPSKGDSLPFYVGTYAYMGVRIPVFYNDRGELCVDVSRCHIRHQAKARELVEEALAQENVAFHIQTENIVS